MGRGLRAKESLAEKIKVQAVDVVLARFVPFGATLPQLFLHLLLLGWEPCACSLPSFPTLPFPSLPFSATSRDSCSPVRASLAEDGRWQRGNGTAVELSAGVVSLPSLRMPNSLNPSPRR